MRMVETALPKRLIGKAESVIMSFLVSFRLLKSGKRLGITCIYSVLIWIVYILTLYIPFFAFGFGARLHLTLYDAVLLTLVTSIAWSVPSPGGAGVYHLFVSQALMIISGVPKDEALTYATLTHLFGYVAITIVGAIFTLIFMRRLGTRSLGGLLRTEPTANASEPKT